MLEKEKGTKKYTSKKVILMVQGESSTAPMDIVSHQLIQNTIELKLKSINKYVNVQRFKEVVNARTNVVEAIREEYVGT